MSQMYKCDYCDWVGEISDAIDDDSVECPKCQEYVNVIDPVHDAHVERMLEMTRQTMGRVVRDNKVAVIISPCWGSGWSSANTHYEEILIFHPRLVAMIESRRSSEITSNWLENEMGLKDVFVYDPEGLCIRWVPKGMKFLIEEQDGAERIILESHLYLTA